MNSGISQLKQVLRRLWRTPLFTVVTLITLGAGVGANIAVFSVVESVLLKPLPYPHAERLVGVWHTAPGLNLDLVNMAPSNYFIYREQNRVFEDMGVYDGDSVSGDGPGESRAGACAGCDGWRAADSGSYAAAGALVQPRRWSTQGGGDGDVGLRVLAAAVRRRSIDRGADRSR